MPQCSLQSIAVERAKVMGIFCIGWVQVMYGNLAPEGSVGKITGKEGLAFQGTARCFDSEEDMLDQLSKDPSSFKVQLPHMFLPYPRTSLI